MAIEEAGPNPQRLADAIHQQIDRARGPVPVADIAAALDIVEIKEAPLRGLEGALVGPLDRNVGAILLNSHSPPLRRRFTLAHELGHFLNVWHQANPSGFACTQGDLKTPWRRPSAESSRHVRQEAEANRFAIELLAPEHLVRRHLRNIPDLADVLKLADDLALSRESGARRYVDLHDRAAALVFAVNGAVRYVERNPNFPSVACRRGDRLPSIPPCVDDTGLSAHEQGDPGDWLARPDGVSLIVQTLHQGQGYSISLLALESEAADEDEDF